jgi:hypothetical protein
MVRACVGVAMPAFTGTAIHSQSRLCTALHGPARSETQNVAPRYRPVVLAAYHRRPVKARRASRLAGAGTGHMSRVGNPRSSRLLHAMRCDAMRGWLMLKQYCLVRVWVQTRRRT